MAGNESTWEQSLLEDRVKTNLWDPALLRRMVRYAAPYKGLVALCTLLLCLSSFFAVLPPVLFGALFDILFQSNESITSRIIAVILESLLPGWGAGDFTALVPTEKLWAFAAFFLFARLATFALDWANGYLLGLLGQKVLYDLRMQIFGHIHSLSLSFFHHSPVGRLVTRTTNDVGALEEFFTTALATVLKDIGMLVGISIFVLALDLRLGLISMSIVPLIVIATLVHRRYSRDAYRKWRGTVSRLNAFMAEMLAGIRVAQLFHRERANDATYGRIGGDYKKYFMDQRRAWAWFRPVITILSALGIGLVVMFGGDMVLSDNGGAVAGAAISLGTLVAFIGYVELFFTPIRDLSEKIDVMQSGMTAAERIFTILDERAEVVDRRGARDPGRLRGDIGFHDVRFAYVADDPVLRGVSFHIEAGRSAAIVGHTGAGKTTIINLLCRFYDIQNGSLTIDGVDVRDYTLRGLRSNVAVVPQDVFLFAGTILDNIRLGAEEISRERVEEACRAVGADAFIRRLEGGYEAVVEENGKTFSAGERQLLSFARALVFDPAILILDEATASVDTETEEVIQRALETIIRGRTSVIIAHRLSTIQRADMILVMHKGELVEQGRHHELVTRRGLYHKLYELQRQSL